MVVSLIGDQMAEVRRLRDAGFFNSAVIQADTVIQLSLIEVCRSRKIDPAIGVEDRGNEREILVERIRGAGIAIPYEEELRKLRQARNALEHPERIRPEDYQSLANSKEWGDYAVLLVDHFLKAMRLA